MSMGFSLFFAYHYINHLENVYSDVSDKPFSGRPNISLLTRSLEEHIIRPTV